MLTTVPPVVGPLNGETSERPGGLKKMNSSPLDTFWLFNVNWSETLVSGGLTLFGGLMHLASVDEYTLAGFFPRGPKLQKVSFELSISLLKSNGLKLLPFKMICEPPLSGPKSGKTLCTSGSL
jgi:hypothetical protein